MLGVTTFQLCHGFNIKDNIISPKSSNCVSDDKTTSSLDLSIAFTWIYHKCFVT